MAQGKTFGIPNWLLIIGIVLAAYFTNFGNFATMVNPYLQNWQTPSAPISPQCPAGQHYDGTQKLCVLDQAVAPYSGPIALTVSGIWGYDSSALALTSSQYKAYDSKMNFLKTMTDASAGTIVVADSDSGVLYLVIEDLTQTVGFVDPDLTKAGSSGYVSSWDLKDVDQNGQQDYVFKLNVASLSVKAGQTAATLNINLYAWKVMTNAGSLSNISSPTGMTTAGDYHNTGYYGSWTGEGYELRMTKMQLYSTNASGTTNSSSNAGSTGILFNAGTVQVKQITFKGTGSQTGTTYGQVFGGVPWDNSNSYFQLYQANRNGVTDVTQTNFAMPFIYERQSGATWLQFDIWIHTSSSAMTSGAKYYVTLTLTFQKTDASTFTEVLTMTWTG